MRFCQNAHCLRGQVHLPQEVGETYDQGQGGAREERAHKPLQFDLHENFQEQRCDDRAHQERRQRACSDCSACEVTPALETLQLELESFGYLKVVRYCLLGELATSVNDSSKTARHHVEDAGDTGKQEDRRQCQLDGVSGVPDVQCRIQHVWLALRGMCGLTFEIWLGGDVIANDLVHVPVGCDEVLPDLA